LNNSGERNAGQAAAKFSSPLGPLLPAYRLIMHLPMGTKAAYVGDFVGFVVTGKSGYYITE
jgi:hypothetical protein